MANNKQRTSKNNQKPKQNLLEKEQGVFSSFFSSIQKNFTSTLSLLSHPAWQGVGAILSLLSLVVTIVLTIYVAIYIFNLEKEQGTAHMYLLGPSSGAILDDRKIKDVSFFVTNDGPAMGKNVNVIVISDVEIECKSGNSFNFSASDIQPTKIINNPKRCDIFFDNFYPNHTAFIGVAASTKENPNPLPPYVTIFGENVSVIRK